MLYLGGYVVAISIEKWNLHRRIALKVMLTIGYTLPRWVLICTPLFKSNGISLQCKIVVFGFSISMCNFACCIMGFCGLCRETCVIFRWRVWIMDRLIFIRGILILVRRNIYIEMSPPPPPPPTHTHTHTQDKQKHGASSKYPEKIDTVGLDKADTASPIASFQMRSGTNFGKLHNSDVTMSSWSLKSPSNCFFNLHLINHQSSPLQGLWWPVDPHKGPVMRKCYHVRELREMFIACMHFTQPKFHQHHQHRKRLSPQLLIFRLLMSSMLSSLLLSMWISNTATATMMIPIVEAVLQQLKRHMVPAPKEGERAG